MGTVVGTAAPRTRKHHSPRAVGPPAVTFAAMLRGINVGGKNKLPMADLVAMFASAGCEDVRSYIQSGNVIFRAPVPLAASAANRVKGNIEEQFGYSIPIVLRTGDELLEVNGKNPFLRDGISADRLHVMFLAEAPDPARIARLDALRSPPDAFVVLGRDIYLHCPNGVAKTRLTNQYFDSMLRTTSTMRNWKTVLKLVEMTRG